MSKRYKNVGTQPIDVGHERFYQPGEEFDAKLAKPREDWFKQIGAIRVVEDKEKKK